jgi:hypothetical protein
MSENFLAEAIAAVRLANINLRMVSGNVQAQAELDLLHRAIGQLQVIQNDLENYTADTYVPTWQR